MERKGLHTKIRTCSEEKGFFTSVNRKVFFSFEMLKVCMHMARGYCCLF
jgi:hypothetical protein